MGEGVIKIEALLGLPEGLEVRSFNVADQEITLTIVRNPAASLLPAVWEQGLPCS